MPLWQGPDEPCLCARWIVILPCCWIFDIVECSKSLNVRLYWEFVLNLEFIHYSTFWGFQIYWESDFLQFLTLFNVFNVFEISTLHLVSTSPREFCWHEKTCAVSYGIFLFSSRRAGNHFLCWHQERCTVSCYTSPSSFWGVLQALSWSAGVRRCACLLSQRLRTYSCVKVLFCSPGI